MYSFFRILHQNQPSHLTVRNIPDGLVVMISACQIPQSLTSAGDRGSIPRRGAICLFLSFERIPRSAQFFFCRVELAMRIPYRYAFPFALLDALTLLLAAPTFSSDKGRCCKWILVYKLQELNNMTCTFATCFLGCLCNLSNLFT
jgi:hypothetical protein